MNRIEALWWLGWMWLVSWIVLPLGLVPVIGLIPAVVVWGVTVPWIGLLALGSVHQLLPASPSGIFSGGDAGVARWRMKTWAPSVYLTLFQPIFFQSQWFSCIALRVFGARIGPRACVTSRTIVREPHRITVGADTIVGEFAHLACSLQPRPGLLVVGDIQIGSETLVGAYAIIGPGARVGNGCVLGHAVVLGLRSRIADGTKIGAGTRIYGRVSIGEGAHIGKACTIFSGARIEAGARIPDGTIVEARAGRKRRAA